MIDFVRYIVDLVFCWNINFKFFDVFVEYCGEIRYGCIDICGVFGIKFCYRL